MKQINNVHLFSTNLMKNYHMMNYIMNMNNLNKIKNFQNNLN